MLLGLSKIIDCPGGVVPFETTLDLSDMVVGGSRPFPSPIEARGQVRNTAGVLLMTGEIQTVLDGVCDRCCKSFRRDFTLPLEAVLVTKLESDTLDDPWTFELVGDEADLDDTFTMTIDITDYCYVNGCSVVGLMVDETVSVRELFYGTILPEAGGAGPL